MAKMRLHLVVPADDGPIHSDVGGTIAGQPLGSKSRWRIACDPNLAMDGIINRGTGEPWAVVCNACRATDLFKAIDRPHPRDQQADDLVADGCC